MVAGRVGARAIVESPGIFARTTALMPERQGCVEGEEVIRYDRDRSRIER
jgi:hypothetical protein